MNAYSMSTVSDLYARCITATERVSPDADGKVVRADGFDRSRKYLLEELTPVPGDASVPGDKQRFVSQTLERVHARLFGLFKRLVDANVLRVSGDHGLGDQIALEARVRFSDEEFERREPTGSRRCPHTGERT